MSVCRVSRLMAKQVRLALFLVAYNMGTFLRRLALPDAVKDSCNQSLQVRLIKIGGRLVQHVCRLVFYLAELAVSRDCSPRIKRLALARG